MFSITEQIVQSISEKFLFEDFFFFLCIDCLLTVIPNSPTLGSKFIGQAEFFAVLYSVVVAI